MRAKILVTDGTRTNNLYWVSHTGTDVYHGSGYRLEKFTYHESGQTHSRIGSEPYQNMQWQQPLQAIDGISVLMTMTVTNDEHWSDGAPNTRPLASNSRANAVLTVDLRSFRQGDHISVTVALMQPNCIEAFGAIIKSHSLSDLLFPGFHQVHQYLIDRSVTPWLMVIVSSSPADGFRQFLRHFPSSREVKIDLERSIREGRVIEAPEGEAFVGWSGPSQSSYRTLEDTIVKDEEEDGTD